MLAIAGWYFLNSQATFVFSDLEVEGDYAVKPSEKIVFKDNAKLSVSGKLLLNGNISCENGALHIAAKGGVVVNGIVKYLPVDQLIIEDEAGCGADHWHAAMGVVTATDGTRVSRTNFAETHRIALKNKVWPRPLQSIRGGFFLAHFRYTCCMIVDGRKIAEEMKEALTDKAADFARMHGRKPRLDIVYVGENPVIENFIGRKKKFGKDIGVEALVHRYAQEISQDALMGEIKRISTDRSSDGIIVQLPLSENFDAQEVLSAIPKEKDIDVLSQEAFESFSSGESPFFPPVAGAVKEILERNKIALENKNILVIGAGKLVGKPVAQWLLREHAHYAVARSKTKNLFELLLNADIIISGIGMSQFIKPEMIKQDAVLIDAGTSEQGGKVLGDADPASAAKCSLFTPVPGGIGPITVAVLFQNLLGK